MFHFNTPKRYEKKIKILIILVIIFIVVHSFLIWNCKQAEKETEKEKEIKSLVEKETEFRGRTYDENLLINLVHVTKDGNNYKIHCKFGPAYQTANLTKLLPNQLASFGQIKNCTTETAREIDEAIRSSPLDCRVPLKLLYSPIPPNLTDYYLITFALEEPVEVDEESFNVLRNRYKCLNNLNKGLIGEKMPLGLVGGEISLVVMVGIIDLDKGIITW